MPFPAARWRSQGTPSKHTHPLLSLSLLHASLSPPHPHAWPRTHSPGIAPHAPPSLLPVSHAPRRSQPSPRPGIWHCSLALACLAEIDSHFSSAESSPPLVLPSPHTLVTTPSFTLSVPLSSRPPQGQRNRSHRLARAALAGVTACGAPGWTRPPRPARIKTRLPPAWIRSDSTQRTRNARRSRCARALAYARASLSSPPHAARDSLMRGRWNFHRPFCQQPCTGESPFSHALARQRISGCTRIDASRDDRTCLFLSISIHRDRGAT